MPVQGIEAMNATLRDVVVRVAPQEVSRIVRTVGLEILRRVMEGTPVDTGRARANWQVSFGAPAPGEVSVPAGSVPYMGSAPPLSVSGGEAFNKGVAALGGIGGNPYVHVFITNNVRYIEILEFGQFTPPDPGPSKDPRPGRLGRILVRGGKSVQGHAMARRAFDSVVAALVARR